MEGQAVLIRAATEDDLPQILDHWKHLNQYHAEFDPAWEVADAGVETFGRSLGLAIKSASGLLLCAAQDDRVIGYLHGMTKINPRTLAEKSVGVIISIFVQPTCRSMGVGEQLIQSALIHFREQGLQRVETLVAATNDRAQGFWQRSGFQTHAIMRSRRL